MSPRHTTALGPGAEFDLIRKFLAHAPPVPGGVVLGAGDDCAVVRGPQLAVSTDMSVEGVHFRRAWLAPREIGYRAAAAALSDLAAMAVRPLGLLASLALPDADAGEPAVELMRGVADAAAAVGAALLGGDVTRSPGPLVIDVAVLGEAAAPVRRGGAVPGDEVWVTGELGGAAAAVEAWLRGDAPPADARERFARPVPRVREALWLGDHVGPTSLIDLSDGLGGDAAHLAAASGAILVLDVDALPVHAAAGGDRARAVRLALAGGEDYELCFTASAGAVDPRRAQFERAFAIPLTRVGTVEPLDDAGPRVLGRSADGTLAPVAHGYRHFAP